MTIYLAFARQILNKHCSALLNNVIIRVNLSAGTGRSVIICGQKEKYEFVLLKMQILIYSLGHLKSNPKTF